MSLGIVSIGSSSSGNSYLVTDGRTRVILDVGLSGKKIKEALAGLGISPLQIEGIFVTHEHTDHVKSVRIMSKACADAEIFASRGTVQGCEAFEDVAAERIDFLSAQDEITVGSITAKAFALSHDAAEPIGYSFRSEGTQLTVVTDTGIVTDEIFEEIKTADILVLEANHEVSVLEVGPYPYYVKRRILSDVGHLSNVSAGETLLRMMDERGLDMMPHVMLAHLSVHNNTPDIARQTVTGILRENELLNGRDYAMGIAAKSEPSRLIKL